MIIYPFRDERKRNFISFLFIKNVLGYSLLPSSLLVFLIRRFLRKQYDRVALFMKHALQRNFDVDELSDSRHEK